ncbi:MAG TPA: efflux RND transporter permease subunit, partial [Motiliproteus sp.]
MHGMITWFARNPVAANLLMVAIMVSGLYSLANRLPLEVFPDIDLDLINVRVSYPGATPTEVEEALAIRIEEEIQDLEGIDSLFSRSTEGSVLVSVEVAKGASPRELMEDIKSRVDAISSFPDEAERPVVSLQQRRREVISAVIYGERSEAELRELAERVRDDLLAIPDITQVVLDSPPAYELAIEVSEYTLKEYGLTLAQVAAAVSAGSVDLSAGNIRTLGADILVRTRGQAYTAEEFGRIPVVTRADGTLVTLGDIARIHDGFEEDPVKTRFNGLPAIALDVFRVGDQNSIALAAKVREYIEAKSQQLPQGLHLDYWRDRSKIVKARLNTLTKNAMQG